MSVDAAPRTGLLPLDQTLAVRDLAVLAAAGAAEADLTRRLSPEVLDGIRTAGFARHFVSADLGGTEGTFAELADAIVAVGAGCASTAWCASLSASSARFASHLPPAGHQELWEDGPDVVIATALPPQGRAVAVAGGHRLTGRWTYVSGIDIAEWVLLCGLVAADVGGEPQARFFAVPRGAFTVIETWDSIGLRATCTQAVVVEDLLVPAHRGFPRAELAGGHNAWSTVHSHNVPFQAVGGLTFIAPALGAAVGALRACVATLSGKRHSSAADLDLVRASGRIDAARLLVAQNSAVLDGRDFTPTSMARNERNAAFAADMLATAATELQRAAGTSGLSESGALQRFWRDITGATSHVALRYETAAVTTYSAALLGG